MHASDELWIVARLFEAYDVGLLDRPNCSAGVCGLHLHMPGICIRLLAEWQTSCTVAANIDDAASAGRHVFQTRTMTHEMQRQSRKKSISGLIEMQ